MAVSPNSQAPSLANLPEGLSPDCLDTIPILTSILSRLQPPNATNLPSSTSGSPPITATPTSKQLKDLENGTEPLTLNQIAILADGIKANIQKARMVVKQLPDMGSSIQEQEREIRELEERIRRQRDTLVKLRDAGIEFAVEEGKDEPKESREVDMMETQE